jgi:Zn finger protein HypA/HybF involved in hydrogenase expression
MSYSEEALAAILDAKADQLRDDKTVEQVTLELGTLLGDIDDVAIKPDGIQDGRVTFEDTDNTDGFALFVPRDIAEMSCDECGGETQTYVHTENGLALCPDCT